MGVLEEVHYEFWVQVVWRIDLQTCRASEGEKLLHYATTGCLGETLVPSFGVSNLNQVRGIQSPRAEAHLACRTLGHGMACSRAAKLRRISYKY